MKNVIIYINGRNAKDTWGVFFTETALTNLMCPAPSKDYIKNKSVLSHGVQVLSEGDYAPKTDERDVQLTFGIVATSVADFLTKFRTFMGEMEKRNIALKVCISEGSTFLNETYFLNYLSCSQFSEFNGRLGRFVIKFNEPNPKNRVVEHSQDIT